MARIASALPRIPPVTSGPRPTRASPWTTASVTSATTTGRPPVEGAKMPGTSLTKSTRRAASSLASTTAIVSALRIDQPHASSGTTSPKETGSSPRPNASRNGAESRATRRPSRFRAWLATGTDHGEVPARISSRTTARWRRRTSPETIAAPRPRREGDASAAGARARPNCRAPGWPNDPAPWSRTRGIPVTEPTSSARRRRIFGRTRSASRFRVMTLPPSLTTTGPTGPDAEAIGRTARLR